MIPETSILNPAFVYIPSDQTNVVETFRRERERTFCGPLRVYYLPRKAVKIRIIDDYADVERDHHLMFAGGFK